VAAVPALKPAYLIRGDDHGRIAERRANLRALAEREGGPGGVEVLEGDAATPGAAVAALAAMTFALGRRVIIVDGVERWADGEVGGELAAALGAIPPDTTIAFFAREEGRAKAPARLAKAVEAAGGDVREEATLKARALPRWAVGEARRLGVELEADAAQALVTLVGERQQRLLRELEKLAIEHGAGARIGLEEVEGAAAHSAERQVWALVDALVARDGDGALRAFLTLRAQGEAIPRLLPLMARRVRDVLAVAARLEAGEAPPEVKRSLRMSSWAADRRLAEARKADPDALRAALVALADLELATRGESELAEDTLALRALAAVAAPVGDGAGGGGA
jgi:DNA polymerase-3 subunit delta